MTSKKKTKEIDKVALEAEYTTLRPLIEQFHRGVVAQIEHLVSTSEITLGTPMQSRVKDWSSLSEKLENIRFDIKSVKDIQDLVGIRLILLFKRDLDRAVEVITNTLKVIQQYNTSERLKDDQFGYSSIHIIAEIPDMWINVPTFANQQGLKVEIQIRTVAQHIWAASSHILQYKQKQAVPSSILRSIYRVSALLETIDLELERVLTERDSYRLTLESPIDEQSQNASLNVDLLEKILDELLPPENKSTDEDFSDLLSDLTYFEITTPTKLAELITKHNDAILEAERGHVLEGSSENRAEYILESSAIDRMSRGVFFTHAGLTRTALAREFGDRWEEYSYKSSAIDDEEI